MVNVLKLAVPAYNFKPNFDLLYVVKNFSQSLSIRVSKNCPLSFSGNSNMEHQLLRKKVHMFGYLRQTL